jgi:hypothetical protein
MKTNSLNLPDNVREYFVSRGYRQVQVEYPDFGGILLYLRKVGVEPQAAYYISKPSTIELVTSDELQRVLDLLEDYGIQLGHAFSTSPFSEASHQFAEEHEINLVPLQTHCAETAPSLGDVHGERQTPRTRLREIVL